MSRVGEPPAPRNLGLVHDFNLLVPSSPNVAGSYLPVPASWRGDSCLGSGWGSQASHSLLVRTDLIVSRSDGPSNGFKGAQRIVVCLIFAMLFYVMP